MHKICMNKICVNTHKFVYKICISVQYKCAINAHKIIYKMRGFCAILCHGLYMKIIKKSLKNHIDLHKIQVKFSLKTR